MNGLLIRRVSILYTVFIIICVCANVKETVGRARANGSRSRRHYNIVVIGRRRRVRDVKGSTPRAKDELAHVARSWGLLRRFRNFSRLSFRSKSCGKHRPPESHILFLCESLSCGSILPASRPIAVCAVPARYWRHHRPLFPLCSLLAQVDIIRVAAEDDRDLELAAAVQQCLHRGPSRSRARHRRFSPAESRVQIAAAHQTRRVIPTSRSIIKCIFTNLKH